MRFWFAVVFSVLVFFTWPATAEEPVYNIENVTGDVYRFSNGTVNGVLMVTGEGAVVVDPGPEALARWLKGEIAARFGILVRYVVYANDRPEHFSGGPVFKETAEYFVHKDAISTHDNLRKTGKVAQAPLIGKELEIGGKKILLMAALPIPAMGVYFPKEKVFYLSDLIQVRSIPDKIFTTGTIRDNLIALFKFDVKIKAFLSGHGGPGGSEEYVEYQGFITALLNQVYELRRNGIGVQEGVEKVDLSAYQDWDRYFERRNQLISHVFKSLEGDENFEMYLETGLVIPIALLGLRIPERLYKKKTCGWTQVEYDVTSEGKTKNIRVIDQSPPGIYELISIQAATRHRYLPKFPGEGVIVTTIFDFDRLCDPPSLSIKGNFTTHYGGKG